MQFLKVFLKIENASIVSIALHARLNGLEAGLYKSIYALNFKTEIYFFRLSIIVYKCL